MQNSSRSNSRPLYFAAFFAAALGCATNAPPASQGDDGAGASAGSAGGTSTGGATSTSGGKSASGGTAGMATTAGGASGATGGSSATSSAGTSTGGTPHGGAAGAPVASGGAAGTNGAHGGSPAGGSANSGAAGHGAGSASTAGASNGGANSAGGASAGGANSTGNAGRASGSAGTNGGGACGTLNLHPFGCKFAWGIADPGGNSYASYGYVDFMSYWVDSSISASGTYSTCNGCAWIQNLAGTNIAPVYVAYIIGFLGHANGIVDGNQDGTKKLTTDGAQLIRDHRQQIVDAYAWYATQTHAVWPERPLVWLLEGDFVQYTDSGQTNPLSYAELASLAADITCAIKGNMSNAVVAIDQSSWNSDDVTNAFWGALKSANVNYDLVWTTGVGNNAGYIDSSTTDTTYNHATATYSYLHTLTGRTILVDTSTGISAAGDSWSVATADDLNARITDGVIAADITGTPPNGLQTNLQTLRPELNGLPGCP